MKILIADDSRVMRQIVARTLRQAGFRGHELIEAENGRRAYEAVLLENPGVVLSDWNMPQMSGLELLYALRSAGHQVPFVFVTSEASSKMRETALEAGALFMITKPFTADEFGRVLEPLLG